MQFCPWEVWLAAVQFEDSPEVKNRPVVITSTGDVFVLALKVTSHPPRNAWGEYALTHWQAAGLRNASTVRISKLLHLRPSDLVHKIGTLDIIDILAIRKILASKQQQGRE